MKKILLILLIIVLIILVSFSVWYFAFRDSEIISGDENLEPVGSVDLSDSGLESEILPEINMDLGFNESESGFELGEPMDLSSPEVDLDAPTVPEIERFTYDSSGLGGELAAQAQAEQTPEGQGGGETTSPPAQTGPTAAECSQFDSAPSCDYVPANVRDVCEQCKSQ